MKKILLAMLISLGAIGFVATSAIAEGDKVEAPTKCQAGKCATGKCGEDKAAPTEDENKTEAKGKCEEGKCGSK